MKTIRPYCVLLSGAQLKMLHRHSKFDRIRCLSLLLNLADMNPRIYTKRDFTTTLRPGDVAAATPELEKLWNCRHGRVESTMEAFRRAGLLSTRSNNRTSIHTLHCLYGWFRDGQFVANENFRYPGAQNPAGDGRRVPEEEADGAKIEEDGTTTGATLTPDSLACELPDEGEKPGAGPSPQSVSHDKACQKQRTGLIGRLLCLMFGGRR